MLVKLDDAVLFEEVKVVASSHHYLACLYKEAIEILKHVYNFNKRGESLNFWHPALQRTQTTGIELQRTQTTGIELQMAGWKQQLLGENNLLN